VLVFCTARKIEEGRNKSWTELVFQGIQTVVYGQFSCLLLVRSFQISCSQLSSGVRSALAQVFFPLELEVPDYEFPPGDFLPFHASPIGYGLVPAIP